MQPKLRGTVTYVPTSDGMLFRNGDAFLPIHGKHVWELYQQIMPLLEAKALSDEERYALLEKYQAVFERFCEALKSGDMLYDASEDARSLVPINIQERYGAQIARIEMTSKCPVRTFAAVSSKNVLILGTAEIALAVVEAALESGLRNLSISCPDWTLEASHSLNELLHRYSFGAHIPVVKAMARCDSGTSVEESPTWDHIVAVGMVGRDWQLLDDLLRPLLGARQASAFVLCLGRSRVVASMVAAAGEGGCNLCIGKYCENTSPSDIPTMDLKARGGISIGAQLVVQHLWDVIVEAPEEDRRQMILELDLRSYAVQRRPRPVDSQCPRCCGTRCVSNPEKWSFVGDGADEFDAVEFCVRAEKLCVDADTGWIVSLDEGELLQYPYHQCAVLLRDISAKTSTLWLTECGQKMLEARVGVIRRSLEYNCENNFRQQYAKTIPTSFYSSSGECKGKWTGATLPIGSVISAANWNELVEKGFYRALARHAVSREEWSELDSFAAMPAGMEVDMISEHLNDIDALKSVLVHKYPLNADNCVVLRFGFQGRPVSVVAGPEWETAWTAGLQDVWMHLTACEALPGYRGLDHSGVRLRAAYKPLKFGLRSSGISSLERTLGLNLFFFPLLIPGITTLFPLSFAYAFLSQSASEITSI